MLLLIFYARTLDYDEMVSAIVDGEFPPVRHEKEYEMLEEVHGKLIIAMEARGSCFQTFKSSEQASKSPSYRPKKRLRAILQQIGDNEDNQDDGPQFGPFRERDHNSLSRQSRLCVPAKCAIAVP